jgi:competence protein ComEC
VASAIVGVVEFAAGLPLACVNVGSPVWGEAEVVALAVGPGQAALVRTGDGCEVFDCAGAWQARGIVAPALRYYGVNRIERLWLGHGDAAHVGGAEALLANWPVGGLIVPGSDVGRGTLAGVVARHATRARVARRGDVLGDRRLRWVVLWPDRDTIRPLADDRGIVARLEWEGGALLFLGDAGASVERELMASGANLRADVILAGRHAREGGLTAEFLDAVGPRHVVFNAGWRAGERLDGGQRRRIEERGILLWDLSETGAVEIRCGNRGPRLSAPHGKPIEKAPGA